MTQTLAPFPLVQELIPPPDPEEAFARFRLASRCVFFDSAQKDANLGRYSFLAAEPFDWLELRPRDLGDFRGSARGASDSPASGFQRLRDTLSRFATPTLADLPPFQGGAAGLLGYEWGRTIEYTPPPRHDEFATPLLAIGWYDVVLAFDHSQSRAWLMSQGFPEIEAAPRAARARRRLEAFLDLLSSTGKAPAGFGERSMGNEAARDLASHELAPSFAIDRWPGLASDFSAEGYLRAVQRAIDYIWAGDVFQVNLSQRLLTPAVGDTHSLYCNLRRRNPAPFASYFDLGKFQIASASPERFARVRDGAVEVRPIKGTRRRGAASEADLFVADELRESEKDGAENTMIVDLLRNDLSKVCLPDSVRVTQLRGLENFAFVRHLVSVIEGRLAPGRTAIDLIEAAFPGGSITGAPKPRAMEIIAELEPTARGPYCGILAYLGFDGAMDASILIRAITSGRGWRQVPVGGGIVAQSEPAREYEETWHKAEGMLRALL